MSTTKIDGKQIAGLVTEKVKERVENLKSKGVVPGLAVVLVGSNPASQTYVNTLGTMIARNAHGFNP